MYFLLYSFARYLPFLGEFKLCDVSTFMVNVLKAGCIFFVLVDKFVHKIHCKYRFCIFG